MQTFLKLLAVLFILVPRCTASEELELIMDTSDKIINTVEGWLGINSKNVPIAPEENQLNQCGEMEKKILLLEHQINESNKANQQLDEYKKLIEKQGAEIKAFSIKDELIASQRAEIEDKIMMLEMQIKKTNKANQQIEDYENQLEKKNLEINTLSNNVEDKLKLLEDFQLQIAKKELEIKNLQLTISSYENNTNNQSNLKNNPPQIVCPNYMDQSYNEAPNLNNKINELEKKQKSCQMDLESERNGSIEKDVAIDDMKKEAAANCKLIKSRWNEANYMNARIKEMEIVAENNENLLDQCQENKRNMQKTEEEKKSVEEKLNECQLNNTNLVKLKDESFKEYQSNQQIILDECQLNNTNLVKLKDESFKEYQIILDECQLNNTNLVKLKDESFKEYQSNQQIILESCQDDLESQRNESTYKTVTIKELNNVAEFNHNLWTQCQKNSEEIQTELDSYKTKDSHNNKLVESCKNQLESQKLETTSKNATINELNKGLDKCKKNNEELNNQLITKEQCAKQCSGKNFLKKAWCKAKCKWHC